ncbi:cation diffusion facilitator family transporter [Paraburkholderia sp. BL6665CI2N2]|uniref:cation diffusion facilitator family transporter n=1 Tax=Paraburkholderia sp. BL6665CI2N2 TaxID=1938806 RepID=UPI001066DE60|nr:cation diffusion facilitator family transporter [Paraburkholderia sp. BL6665CI2N2]TDY21650.1 cation diffusion facilitator family transporter [Paraburkholderia sp. BL6665CI2N2]
MFKAAFASALLNAFLSAMQIAIGLMAHSDGLFADGVHTLSDLAADGVVLIVLYLTTRHPRAAGTSADAGIEQALATLFIAAVLMVTAAGMLWTSVAQTSTLGGGTTMHIGALAVSGFVMFAKEALFRYMRAEGTRTGSAILLASAWHARVDAVSALVATSGLAGSLAGMPMLDHIAGAAIGLMIMRMGFVSGRSALKQLFAGSPGNATAAARPAE